MKSFLKLVSCMAVLAGTSPALADITARPIPIEVFANVPEITSVSMSFEGDMISAIVAEPGSDGERSALATWDLTDPSFPVTITPSGERSQFVAVSALKGGLNLVTSRQELTASIGGCGIEGVSTGATRTHLLRALLTNKSHDDFDEAFGSNTRTIGVSENTQRCFEILGDSSLASLLPTDPEHVLISRVNPATLTSQFYRYNLESGRAERLGMNVPGGVAFINNRTLEALASSEFEPVGDDFRNDFYLKNPNTGNLELQPEMSNLASNRYTMVVDGFDEQTGEFFIVTDKFSNFTQVYTYDARTKSFGNEPLLAHPQYDITGLVYSQHEHNYNQIIGYTYSGASPRVVWLDPNLSQLQDNLNASFSGQNVRLIDWTAGFDRVLFSVAETSGPSAFYVMSNLSEVRLLGKQIPEMDNYEVSPDRLVYYTARDGLRIPAILTTPAGWTEADGPLPAIVLPHGGPWVRDFVGWDAWTQFYASRGHAVLRPNYRGSQGMGRELWLAGDMNWGLTMQDDKDDGAAWLVQQGIADPDKIAIFGYSYGGFAAFAAVVRPNSPYQCAIAGAGVSNLERLGNLWSDNRLQRAFQGRTVTGMDPIENIENANIPVLIFHGDRDVRVPLFHSEDFYRLVRNEVHAEYLELEGMGHQSIFWYPDHYRDSFAAMEEFLQNDCGPGGLYQ